MNVAGSRTLIRRSAEQWQVLHDAAELDLILCEHHVRKLTKNLTIRFECCEYPWRRPFKPAETGVAAG